MVLPTAGVRARTLADALVEGARESVERAPMYDAGYYELDFPGGDPGWERGTSSDLVIRAFRKAAIDLQLLVVEDIAAHPEVYRLRSADPNIDHRRVKNLVYLFQRQGLAIPVSSDDWQPGDIAVWARGGDRATHMGIVSDRRSREGRRLVIYHTTEASRRPVEADALGSWPLIGHYRWQRPEDVQVAPPRLAQSSPKTSASTDAEARSESTLPPQPQLESQPETPIDIPPVIVDIPAVAEPTPTPPPAPAPPPAARAQSGFTSDGQLGRSVAIGDFNGDGYADFAIGAPGKKDGEGRNSEIGLVLLFKGSETGLQAWQDIGQTSLGEDKTAAQFGWALAAGDFNGDGVDDLAVGAPGESPWAERPSGWVFLFRGTPDGLRSWGGLGQGSMGRNEAGDRFGWALTASDLNGDGITDLAVGAPGESTSGAIGTGWVFAYRGSEGGLEEWGGFGQEGLGTDEADDRFGTSLAARDFNGDGVNDLAVGAPGEVPGYKDQSGWVYVFKGGAESMEGWQSFGQIGLGRDETGDEFGAALTAGDFNDDGIGDLVVGAPGEAFGREAQSGWVFLYYGSEYGMRSWKSLGQEDLEKNEPNDRFGSALMAGDFDGDGRSDLAIGVPGEANEGGVGSGSVFLYRGAGSDLVPWLMVDREAMGGERYDRFGMSLGIGDFDRDGKDDLAIGAPGAADGTLSTPALGYLVNGVNFIPQKLPGLDEEPTDGR